MTELSISERRAVSASISADPALAAELRSQPHAVISRLTGKSLPASMRIELVEEQTGTVLVVLPRTAALAEGLPAAPDMRGSIENDLLALFTVDPTARERLAADPKDFLAKECSIDIGELKVDVRLETGEVTYIALAAPATEELSDEMLELVSGGDKGGERMCKTAYA
jgi:hypothetical protein